MAGEDPMYIARVKRLPCCAPGGCSSLLPRIAIEAHHHRHKQTGTGQKAHDYESMPLCVTDHRFFHALMGPFKNMKKAELTEWQDRMAYETRLKVLAQMKAGTKGLIGYMMAKAKKGIDRP